MSRINEYNSTESLTSHCIQKLNLVRLRLKLERKKLSDFRRKIKVTTFMGSGKGRVFLNTINPPQKSHKGK
jgi:hypothetical protein